jgi:hypothetical protein
VSDRRPDELADSPEEDERSGFIPDLLRRAMVMGFSGFFTTEAAIRRALGETVSPDLVGFAAEQGERARQDLLERVTREVGRVLEKVDVADVLQKVLEGRTVEVTARIRLVEPDEESKPSGGAKPSDQK